MNWTIVKDFASEHRTWIIWIVVVLAALGGGFAAGTYLKPAKVVEKEKITYQEKIVYQDKIVEKIVESLVLVGGFYRRQMVSTGLGKASQVVVPI